MRGEKNRNQSILCEKDLFSMKKKKNKHENKIEAWACVGKPQAKGNTRVDWESKTPRGSISTEKVLGS